MTVSVAPAEGLALAAAGAWLGHWVQARVGWIQRACIPAPIVGGVLLAAPLVAMQSGWAWEFRFDLGLRDLLMVAFFSTIGLGASLRVLREGGGLLLGLFALAVAGAAVQNATGVLAALGLGLDPRIGIIAGAMTLAGGPATALAFSGDFAKAGVADAQAIAMACAVAGNLAAGLVSAAMGAWWVARSQKEQAEKRREGKAVLATEVPANVAAPKAAAEGAEAGVVLPLLWLLGLVVVCLGLGALLTRGFVAMGVKLPEYIGGLLVGAVVRNGLEWRGYRLRGKELGLVGQVCLQLFMVMTIVGLRWSALAELGPKLVVLLLVQTGVTVLMAWALPWLWGRSYEAAVLATGWCGFMLGTTANAVAAMEELTRRHGPALRAYALIPVVGGFLIDFSNAILILGGADLVTRFLLR